MKLDCIQSPVAVSGDRVWILEKTLDRSYRGLVISLQRRMLLRTWMKVARDDAEVPLMENIQLTV